MKSEMCSFISTVKNKFQEFSTPSLTQVLEKEGKGGQKQQGTNLLARSKYGYKTVPFISAPPGACGKCDSVSFLCECIFQYSPQDLLLKGTCFLLCYSSDTVEGRSKATKLIPQLTSPTFGRTPQYFRKVGTGLQHGVDDFCNILIDRAGTEICMHMWYSPFVVTERCYVYIVPYPILLAFLSALLIFFRCALLEVVFFLLLFVLFFFFLSHSLLNQDEIENSPVSSNSGVLVGVHEYVEVVVSWKREMVICQVNFFKAKNVIAIILTHSYLLSFYQHPKLLLKVNHLEICLQLDKAIDDYYANFLRFIT